MYHLCIYHRHRVCPSTFFFFFNDTATTEIYTLSLHDALPICAFHCDQHHSWRQHRQCDGSQSQSGLSDQRHNGRRRSESPLRSEEHTSELQSRSDLVCRLLLEKKNTPRDTSNTYRVLIPWLEL